MTEDSPIGISEREWERGLWWMVLASGGMHVAVFVLLLLIPSSFVHHPGALVSYTVDLVAPDKVGGTNLVPGGKGRIEAAPLAPAPPPAAPPAPKIEPPKPAPPKIVEAKPPEVKPEPQKPAPEKPAPQEVAGKPEPPKPEEKPEPKSKEDEAAVALKVKTVGPPPAPTAVKAAPSPAVKAAPSPKAKPAPSPKVVAKVEAAKVRPAPPPKVDPEAAKKAAAEAAARQRDERILAAVKRVEQSGARGGGTGAKSGEQPGGPLSVGPGQGAGGTVIGLEYQLYYNALINRLKQSWAWAGANRSLEAVVRFSITENGDVVDVRITRASGDPSYDLSVERAVKAVNPLPPPPDAYRKEFSDVEITFSPENLQM